MGTWNVSVAEVADIDGQIAAEVATEVVRQIELWQVQAHPDGTGPHVPLIYIGLASKVREDARNVCESAAQRGKLTWRHILTEEVFEGLAEAQGTEELRGELIQAAAVVLSWVRDLDLRRSEAQAEADAEEEAAAQADLVKPVQP
ncbi:MAG TPA: hypothetical protein VGH72_33675 [Pseudonocardia sp.]|jgi:hypothetical protein